MEPARICGYYVLTLAELDSRNLPIAHRKKFPPRVPGVRLGRLGVDKCFQRKGLGELMLIDALIRTQRIYAEAGGIGLFVDAIDERAAGYYKRFGFISMPDNPHQLFFPASSLKLINEDW